MDNNKKISVVIATYNGAKFLQEQLDSIRKQSVKVDEVIIRDDCSKDATWKLLHDYVTENKLSNWHLYQSKSNEGWMVNFKKAIQLATGDVILLSDQDDVWVENKVEKICQVLKDNPEVELIAHDYDLLINEKVKKKFRREGELIKQEFNSRFFHSQRPGAAFAFKKNMFTDVHDYWNDKLPHDAQLWTIATVRGTLYLYNVPLILYRRHENTVTGHEGLSVETKLKNVRFEKELVCMANAYDKDKKLFTEKMKKKCKYALRYTKLREEFLDSKKLICLFKLLPCLRSYISPKTYIGDMVAVFKAVL